MTESESLAFIKELCRYKTYQERIDVIAEDIQSKKNRFKLFSDHYPEKLLKLLTDEDIESNERYYWTNRDEWESIL